ncbi:MAG: hypothetical protein JOY71_01100 [Acetobacteraceae bacterium]|nr:hypothetical protein [Acetobacteraceae bacterium]
MSYAFPRGVQMRFKSRQVPAYPLRIFALGWFAFSLAILAIDTLVIAFHPFGKWEFVAVIGAPLVVLLVLGPLRIYARKQSISFIPSQDLYAERRSQAKELPIWALLLWLFACIGPIAVGVHELAQRQVLWQWQALDWGGVIAQTAGFVVMGALSLRFNVSRWSVFAAGLIVIMVVLAACFLILPLKTDPNAGFYIGPGAFKLHSLEGRSH